MAYPLAASVGTWDTCQLLDVAQLVAVVEHQMMMVVEAGKLWGAHLTPSWRGLCWSGFHAAPTDIERECGRVHAPWCRSLPHRCVCSVERKSAGDALTPLYTPQGRCLLADYVRIREKGSEAL